MFNAAFPSVHVNAAPPPHIHLPPSFSGAAPLSPPAGSTQQQQYQQPQRFAYEHHQHAPYTETPAYQQSQPTHYYDPQLQQQQYPGHTAQHQQQQQQHQLVPQSHHHRQHHYHQPHHHHHHQPHVPHHNNNNNNHNINHHYPHREEPAYLSASKVLEDQFNLMLARRKALYDVNMFGKHAELGRDSFEVLKRENKLMEMRVQGVRERLGLTVKPSRSLLKNSTYYDPDGKYALMKC